ncbi:MAG: serine hydrolase [Bacteroidales bacterium]|nr:serine hydrolase [Bacteroidales bacterium]
MKFINFFSIIGIILSINYCYGQTNLTDSLDFYVEKSLMEFNVPGASVAVVTKDSLIYVKGFGSKTIDKNDPVNKNTLFAIGSITKSFTALA